MTEQQGGACNSDFKPAWGLSNPHLQTLWPFLFRRQPHLPLQRERLELADGDFIDLDWHVSPAVVKIKGLCILLHGLEGDSRSHYIPALMQKLAMQGWRTLLMHFRGCSGEHNRLARGYHSGDTADFNEVLMQLLQREQPLRTAAIGFSLGGNVLLKYLGEQGSQIRLQAAVAVSVPFELAAGADRLACGFSRMYQWWLIRSLQRKLYDKFSRHLSAGECPLPLHELKQQKTFYQFDNTMTAPLHGFADVHDYYTQSSSRQYLPDIRCPTLILHALDDPFLSPVAIPADSELSTSTRLEVSAHGGHVGFVGGTIRQPEYWLDSRICQYLTD